MPFQTQLIEGQHIKGNQIFLFSFFATGNLAGELYSLLVTPLAADAVEFLVVVLPGGLMSLETWPSRVIDAACSGAVCDLCLLSRFASIRRWLNELRVFPELQFTTFAMISSFFFLPCESLTTFVSEGNHPAWEGELGDWGFWLEWRSGEALCLLMSLTGSTRVMNEGASKSSVLSARCSLEVLLPFFKAASDDSVDVWILMFGAASTLRSVGAYVASLVGETVPSVSTNKPPVCKNRFWPGMRMLLLWKKIISWTTKWSGKYGEPHK